MSDIIEHLRELRARATGGRWVVHDGCSWRRISSVQADYSHRDGDVLRPTKAPDGHPDLESGDGRRDANLALIVAAVNHLDLLLDAAEAAEKAASILDKGFDVLPGYEVGSELVASVRALREARVK